MDNWVEITKRYPEANFLQSPEYGKMNEILGCKVITEDFKGEGYMLAIVRDAKRGRYLEIPCGPLLDWGDIKARRRVLEKIVQIAKKNKCVFVRMRPQLPMSPESMLILEEMRLKKSPMHLAAEHTVMINLLKSEEELLSDMRRQTRYEVRRAEKLGISVEFSDTEEIFKEFHAVQAETAKRQNFVPPSLEVLMAEREAFKKDIRIYTASIKEEGLNGMSLDYNIARIKVPETGVVLESKQPIAYGLIIASGEEADYYEAASTPLNRKLPGAYALLWKAIRDYRKMGYTRFNLWGIAPAGQPNHRYAGVTTFKTGFGGEVTEYVPAHDLVISQTKYLKDLIVETVRRKWRHL